MFYYKSPASVMMVRGKSVRPGFLNRIAEASRFRPRALKECGVVADRPPASVTFSQPVPARGRG